MGFNSGFKELSVCLYPVTRMQNKMPIQDSKYSFKNMKIFEYLRKEWHTKKEVTMLLGAGVSTDVHEIILRHWSIEKEKRQDEKKLHHNKVYKCYSSIYIMFETCKSVFSGLCCLWTHNSEWWIFIENCITYCAVVWKNSYLRIFSVLKYYVASVIMPQKNVKFIVS